MASWRDTTDQQAQDDLDDLVDAGFGTAEEQLRQHGEFYPFAVTRSLDGDTELLGVTAEGEHPEVADVLTDLWQVLTETREDLRAVGVVSNRVANGTDAVAVQLEHREGAAIEVSLPYQLAESEFSPGQISAGEGVRRVWS